MKTKSISLFMIAAIVVGITITSCKKEESSPIPSPWLAERGTPIPDSVTCKDEVVEFISLFQQCRTKHSNPTIYYDRRLIDIMKKDEDNGSAAYNKIDAEYYVTLADRVRYGKFMPYYMESTIESPKDFFANVEKSPEKYKVFTGNFPDNAERFFSDYDIVGLNLKKYTDGCLAGKYKLTIIVWVGLPPHN